jgi:hypothetical protein
MIPTTSTWWTFTLDDNPPVPVVDPTGGPGPRDVTVAGWPFGPGPWPPTPRSYPAALERHDGPFVVERIIGQASDAERLAFARQALASRLGAKPFAAAVAHGEAMSPDAVVDFAVAELRRALAGAAPPG